MRTDQEETGGGEVEICVLAKASQESRAPALVLELRRGDLLVINGAPIRFKTRSRIELTEKARFLFGKQIMASKEATSPARQIYFALQAAYIGSSEEQAAGLSLARKLTAQLKQTITSEAAGQMLDNALAAAEADDCYQALKLVRHIIAYEDNLPQRRPAARAQPDIHKEYREPCQA